MNNSNKTYAQQALEKLYSDNTGLSWEDCFRGFPLHPFSEGIEYTKGRWMGGKWQANLSYHWVFADGSTVKQKEGTWEEAEPFDLNRMLQAYSLESAQEIKDKLAKNKVN